MEVHWSSKPAILGVRIPLRPLRIYGLALVGRRSDILENVGSNPVRVVWAYSVAWRRTGLLILETRVQIPLSPYDVYPRGKESPLQGENRRFESVHVN